jgi:hypothetical protein
VPDITFPETFSFVAEVQKKSRMAVATQFAVLWHPKEADVTMFDANSPWHCPCIATFVDASPGE